MLCVPALPPQDSLLRSDPAAVDTTCTFTHKVPRERVYRSHHQSPQRQPPSCVMAASKLASTSSISHTGSCVRSSRSADELISRLYHIRPPYTSTCTFKKLPPCAGPLSCPQQPGETLQCELSRCAAFHPNDTPHFQATLHPSRATLHDMLMMWLQAAGLGGDLHAAMHDATDSHSGPAKVVSSPTTQLTGYKNIALENIKCSKQIAAGPAARHVMAFDMGQKISGIMTAELPVHS